MLGTALRWVSPGVGLQHNAVISKGVVPPSSKGKPGLFSSSGLCTQRLLALPALGAACRRLEPCTQPSGESCRDSFCAAAMEG